MRTVEGKPNTHYISRQEWDLSYMVNKPIINQLEAGDIVIISDGRNTTTYEIVLKKALKTI